MKKAVELFQKFFFEPRSLYHLGLMRLLVSSALFGLYCWRHLEVDRFFTDEKDFILKSEAPLLLPEFLRSPVSFFIWPDPWVPFAHGFLLVGLLGLMLGVGGRFWTLCTWILSLSFFQRNIFVAYGADLIGNLWLFYLAWTRHHQYFSILNLFRPERIHSIRCDILSSAGARLIQIHLCLIYGYTGLQKLKGTSWWDGTALWTVLGNPQLTVMDLAWMSQWPTLIALAGFSTLFFEIYFPALIWNRTLRPCFLCFGLVLHGGIALTMGIWSFGLVMISSYVLFWKKEIPSSHETLFGWRQMAKRRGVRSSKPT